MKSSRGNLFRRDDSSSSSEAPEVETLDLIATSAVAGLLLTLLLVLVQ
jgi:hypothetical protein